jgi:hypothetical protein
MSEQRKIYRRLARHNGDSAVYNFQRWQSRHALAAEHQASSDAATDQEMKHWFAARADELRIFALDYEQYIVPRARAAWRAALASLEA